MRRMRAPLLALALLPALAAGCDPCVDQCRAQSTTFDDCLEEWGLEWDDFDAEDQVSYRTQCVSEVDRRQDSLDDESRAGEARQCRALTDRLRATSDCETAWEAMVEYGATP